MRILALDVGEKNIGLAVSDQLGITAQGLPSLRRREKEKDIQDIARIAKANEAAEIVVGWPLNLNGRPGKKAQEIAKFIEELKKELPLPIKLWDERLSSVQAEKIMLWQDASRKKRKQKIDRLAAQLILQSYLDSKKPLKTFGEDV